MPFVLAAIIRRARDKHIGADHRRPPSWPLHLFVYRQSGRGVCVCLSEARKQTARAWRQNKSDSNDAALCRDSVQSDRLYRLWLRCHAFRKRRAPKKRPCSFLHHASHFTYNFSLNRMLKRAAAHKGEFLAQIADNKRVLARWPFHFVIMGEGR